MKLVLDDVIFHLRCESQVSSFNILCMYNEPKNEITKCYVIMMIKHILKIITLASCTKNSNCISTYLSEASKKIQTDIF